VASGSGAFGRIPLPPRPSIPYTRLLTLNLDQTPNPETGQQTPARKPGLTDAPGRNAVWMSWFEFLGLEFRVEI